MVVMPIGGFLDSVPSMMYVGAHVIFLLVGLWALKRASDKKSKFASALSLYIASEIVFLGFFGGMITMKMGVLVE
jgi:hypothetical protein